MRGWKSPILVIPLDPAGTPHGRVDITPFMEEACAALGFVRPDCVEWLRDVVVGFEHETSKTVTREIIKHLCPDRPKGSRAPLDLTHLIHDGFFLRLAGVAQCADIA
ncbi:hypothetical protein [uncultured Rhodoblastus sp.]|uniref:hypothetical protein n=1 Tax=uncultured Rhodoblastus sp. TaxID=543037 RepID=UPI0025E323A6|nr:hypothetical protein [uncultured Rhodoblastus sp.]